MQLDNMLLQACKNNKKSVAQTFLKRGGVDVNKRDESGNTPLIYACMKNARDLVKLLLENGADVNLGNQRDRMPLHFAAEAGSPEIIGLLTGAGADVNCTDMNGVTPLMVMAQNGRTDAALKFIQNPDIDLKLKDNDNHMAIDYATSSGLRELVKALSQTEEEHTDAYGNTTLHHACWNEQGEVDLSVKELKEMDIAIASMHAPCYKGAMDKESITRAYIHAMENPYVDIIGHPDDSRFPVDYERLVRTAKETGTLLEVNNSSLRPTSFRQNAWENMCRMLELCRQYGARIVLGTDSHVDQTIADYARTEELLKETGFPEELIANTSLEGLKALLKRGKKR